VDTIHEGRVIAHFGEAGKMSRIPGAGLTLAFRGSG